MVNKTRQKKQLRTQAFLIRRSDLKKLDPRALKLLRIIKQRHVIIVNLKKVM